MTAQQAFIGRPTKVCFELLFAHHFLGKTGRRFSRMMLGADAENCAANPKFAALRMKDDLHFRAPMGDDCRDL